MVDGTKKIQGPAVPIPQPAPQAVTEPTKKQDPSSLNAKSSYDGSQKSGESVLVTGTAAAREQARQASKNAVDGQNKPMDAVTTAETLGRMDTILAAGNQVRRQLDRTRDGAKGVRDGVELVKGTAGRTGAFIDNAMKSPVGQVVSKGVTVGNFVANTTVAINQFPEAKQNLAHSVETGKDWDKTANSVGNQATSTTWAITGGLRTAEMVVEKMGTTGTVAKNVLGTAITKVGPVAATAVAAGEMARLGAVLSDKNASIGKQATRLFTATAASVAAFGAWTGNPLLYGAATGATMLGRALEPAN